MNENQTEDDIPAPVESIRPTKKQQELLSFIGQFINEHSYSPSYREIMVGLNYTSVATVALHVRNLIARGHLRKRGNDARSLELVNQDEVVNTAASSGVVPTLAELLEAELKKRILELETSGLEDEEQAEEYMVLLAAGRLLGVDEEVVDSCADRLSALEATSEV